MGWAMKDGTRNIYDLLLCGKIAIERNLSMNVEVVY